MRTSRTVGFAIDPADEPRLDHLTAVFGNGNRSAFLRQALDVMEKLELARRLGRTQAYGEQRLVAMDLTVADIPDLVARALADPDPDAVAKAKLIVSGTQRRRRAKGADGERHPVAQVAQELLQSHHDR